MAIERRSAQARYGSALASVLLATVVRLSLNPLLGSNFPYIFYFIALAFSAGFCGTGPAFAALAASGVVLRLLILQPQTAVSPTDTHSEIGLWIYMVVGTVVALLGGAMWAARRRAEMSADEAREKQELLEREIAERKRIEQALRETDVRKDEFLAVLAHELRNPLAPIRNALHMMKHPFDNPRDFEAERAMAERQVVHLARLVDDLMDVSRISQGKIELRKEVVDLRHILDRALEPARSLFQERQHRLELSVTSEPIYIEADPTRLEQVLDNLLSNAAKYTEVGGRIWVTIEQVNGEAVVKVRDSGVGIEPEMLSRIFEMFVQAARHGKRANGGLGIGLNLVKRLVELHGGAISAQSEGIGQGSTFEIRLPVLTNVDIPPIPPQSAAPSTPAPARAEAAPAPASGLPRRRILVVDDNEDAARTLAKLLSRLHGQEVRVAHDGATALETAKAFRPELVLLDIGMPGMDGYEVAKRFRPTPEAQGALLVALTGWGQESDRSRSREAGFDHHLVKPVDPEVIRGLIVEMSL